MHRWIEHTFFVSFLITILVAGCGVHQSGGSQPKYPVDSAPATASKGPQQQMKGGDAESVGGGDIFSNNRQALIGNLKLLRDNPELIRHLGQYSFDCPKTHPASLCDRAKAVSKNPDLVDAVQSIARLGVQQLIDVYTNTPIVGKAPPVIAKYSDGTPHQTQESVAPNEAGKITITIDNSVLNMPVEVANFLVAHAGLHAAASGTFYGRKNDDEVIIMRDTLKSFTAQVLYDAWGISLVLLDLTERTSVLRGVAAALIHDTDLLHHVASQEEIFALIPVLQNTDINVVTSSLLKTPENYKNFIVGLCTTHLARTCRPVEVNNWVVALTADPSPRYEPVQVVFLAADETYTRLGSTPDSWVRGIFDILLHRRPTDAELTYFLTYGARFGERSDRSTIVWLIMDLPEYKRSMVDSLYLNYLGRHATETEVANTWGRNPVWFAGWYRFDFEAKLASSLEYWQRNVH